MPTKKSTAKSKPSKAKRNGHTAPIDQPVTHSIDLPPGVEVVTAHLSDFKLDPNNLNDHTPRGHSLLTREIEQNGIGRGTFATRDGVIKAGNLTTEVVGQVMGDIPAIVVRSKGDVQVIHQRMDLESTDERAVQMGLADNWIAFASLNLNPEQITALDPALRDRYMFKEEVAKILAGRSDLIQWPMLSDIEETVARTDGAEVLQIAIDNHRALKAVTDAIDNLFESNPKWRARILKQA